MARAPSFWFVAAMATALLGAGVARGQRMDVMVREAEVQFTSPGIAFHGARPQAVLLTGPDAAPVTIEPQGQATQTTAARQTPMGPATATTWAWEDSRGYGLTWTVSKLQGRPGFTLQMSFANRSPQSVRLRELWLCGPGSTLQTQGDGASWWLATPDSHDSSRGGFQPSGDLARAVKRKYLDTLTLYRQQGRQGIVMGAAGPPQADVRFHCEITSGGMNMGIASEMTDIRVDPGEARHTDEVVVLAEPYDVAMTALVKWIAATHGSRTARGPIVGWCSWYDRGKRITADHVNAVTAAVESQRDRIPMQVIQIDDGWQMAYGNWQVDTQKFPDGMQAVADRIKAAGAIPGIWMCMVRTSAQGAHPDGGQSDWLDPTHPAVQAFIRQSIAARMREGYRYYKFDFNNPRVIGRYDQKKTRLQLHRDLFKLYREAVGEESYLLACVGGMSRGCYGYADASRIGTDSCGKWGEFYKGCCIIDCINAVGSTALANGILFANDPDVSYTLPRGSLSGEELRTWHAFVGLLGGLMMVSEPLQEPKYLAPESLRMLEILNPPAPDKGRSFGGGTDPFHRQFGFLAQRPWGNFATVHLWNPAERAAALSLKDMPLETLGRRFHVWSFWDETYLGIADDRFATKALPPHAGALLRLTALAQDEETPVLVGSTLHIAMGSAEIQSIQAAASRLSITLTDAGAREGKLFVYSRKPLAMVASTGCQASVSASGPNLWIITVSKRERGGMNRMELKVGG